MRRPRRLTTIPGTGAINATALAAAIGNAQTFGPGRDLAAWLGLVPKADDHGRQAQTSRDQQAWQRLLAQDADPWRACRLADTLQIQRPPWVDGCGALLARAHVNTVVVALAAKPARIICAVLHSRQPFEMKAATTL